ncbi:MAG: acyl carrier protein [Planctomycetes bacterium]|nr:acyl carrier protein [Planctomycetota bacterium]
MSIPTPDAETVDRIISIIRRDLMLGADADIDVQTKLFGSDFDMDSLDALLLMQSLEAEFGFKMASESFGPDVFESVASLAGFVVSRGVVPSRSPES